MALFCPNFSNKEVKKEFNELVDAVGENAAYYLWNENNGYSLDKAPNGASSKLFSSLLEHYNGDRRLAIIQKAKTYSQGFRNWFGDWVKIQQLVIGEGGKNAFTGVSTVVDSNGEPMIVYHGTNTVFDEFKHINAGDTTGITVYTDKRTGEQFESDSNNVFFFSSKRSVGESYARLAVHKDLLRLHMQVNSLIGTFAKGSASISLDYFKSFEDFCTTLNKLSKFSPRFTALANYIRLLRYKLQRLTQKEVNAARQMFIQVRKKLEELTDQWFFSSQDSWNNVFEDDQKFLDEYNSKEGARRLKNGEIPKQISDRLYSRRDFSKTDKNTDPDNEYMYWDENSKSWRYHDDDETLLFSNGLNGYYDTTILYNHDEGLYVSTLNGVHTKLSLMTVPQILNLLSDLLQTLNTSKKNLAEVDQYNIYSDNMLLYPCYLNVRNPLDFDYEGTSMGGGFKGGNYPFGYVAARQVKRAMQQLNDGVIYRNILDPYLADNYGVFNSLLVKSIENNGRFNPNDPNIRHQISTLRHFQECMSAFDNAVKNHDLNQYKVFLQNKQKQLVNGLTIELQLLYPEVELNFHETGIVGEDSNVKGRYNAESRVIDVVEILATEDTIPHEYAHHFIQVFRNSKLVQEALDVYGDEEALVQAIAEQSIKLKGKAWGWWNRFVDWLTNIFKSTDARTKARIRRVLTNAFLTREDLMQYGAAEEVKLTDNVHYSRVNVDTVEKLVRDIKSGAESRLNTLKHYKVRNPRSEEAVSRLIDKLQIADNIQNVMDFISHVENTIKDAEEFTSRSLDLISSKQLVQLKHDYLDFYKPLLENAKYLMTVGALGPLFADRDSVEYKNLTTIINALDCVGMKYDWLLKQYSRKFLIDYATQSGNPMINQLIDWLDDPKNDVSWLGCWLGQNSTSSSEVIRICENIVRNIKNKTDRNTFEVGTRLVNLLAKARKDYGHDVMKLFYEKDRNGNSTGYYIRERNYGQMYQDITEYADKQLADLGVIKDQDGNYDFADFETKREFNRRMNNFYSTHCIRRYKAEYYNLRNELSELTITALDNIQKEINYIMDRYKKDDIFLSSEMTDEDKAQFESLLKAKNALYSLYYSDGSKKSGTDLLIAEELSEFREATRYRLNYKPDMDKFNKAYMMVLSKYGDGSKEAIDWMRYNTEEVYSQEFYDAIDSGTRDLYESNDQYKELMKKRQLLLSQFRITGTQREYEDLNPQLERMLNDLDAQIEYLKAEILLDAKSNGFKGSKEAFESFKEFAEVATTAQYRRDYANAKSLGEEEFQKWYDRNHHENGRGQMVPLSRYVYIRPNAKYYRKYTRLKPGKFFSELDMSSQLADPEFIQNGEAYQPKWGMYDNSKQFNKIEGSALELYKALLDAKEESDKKITFLGNTNKYKMPQIEARDNIVLNRGLKTKSLGKSLKYIFKRSIAVRDQDEDYNGINKKQFRPDGSQIKLVPTRYLRMLDDPSKISSDAVGSMIQYYEMAENYKNTSEMLSDLESLLDYAKLVTSEDSRMTLKLQTLLERNMYGRKTDKLNKDGGRIEWSKVSSQAYNYISKVNLGLNPAVATTNYATGLVYTTLESTYGRYFGKDDLAFAESEMLRNCGIIFNIGRAKSRNKVVMLMLMNQISRTNNETFERLDQYWVTRAVQQHGMFAGLSAGDFTVKSQILLSVYSNYRLIDGKFIPKSLFKGDKKLWKEATRLYDAYEVKNGELVVKDEYKDFVNERLKNNVANKIETICNKVDGMLSDTDKSQLYSNCFARWLLMHRGFMVNNVEDLFKEEQFNYDTGEVETGIARSTWKAIKSLWNKDITLTEDNKYGARKVATEVGVVALMSILSTFLISKIADDNKRKYWWQFVNYIWIRCGFEMSAKYNPYELLAILDSPTAGKSTLLNVLHFAKLLFPSTYFDKKHSPAKKVEKGPYKGMPLIEKDLIQVTPFHSVVELTNTHAIIQKKKNQEYQLSY